MIDYKQNIVARTMIADLIGKGFSLEEASKVIYETLTSEKMSCEEDLPNPAFDEEVLRIKNG